MSVIKIIAVQLDYACNTARAVQIIINRISRWGYASKSSSSIGRASLARENEAGDSWGQEVHILHVNV